MLSHPDLNLHALLPAPCRTRLRPVALPRASTYAEFTAFVASVQAVSKPKVWSIIGTSWRQPLGDLLMPDVVGRTCFTILEMEDQHGWNWTVRSR